MSRNSPNRTVKVGKLFECGFVIERGNTFVNGRHRRANGVAGWRGEVASGRARRDRDGRTIRRPREAERARAIKDEPTMRE